MQAQACATIYFFEIFLVDFFFAGVAFFFFAGVAVKVRVSSSQASRTRLKMVRTILPTSLKSRPPARGIIIQVVTSAWRMRWSVLLGARYSKKEAGEGFLMADQTFMLRSKTNSSCLRAAARVRPSSGYSRQTESRASVMSFSTP